MRDYAGRRLSASLLAYGTTQSSLGVVVDNSNLLTIDTSDAAEHLLARMLMR